MRFNCLSNFKHNNGRVGRRLFVQYTETKAQHTKHTEHKAVNYAKTATNKHARVPSTTTTTTTTRNNPTTKNKQQPNECIRSNPDRKKHAFTQQQHTITHGQRMHTEYRPHTNVVTTKHKGNQSRARARVLCSKYIATQAGAAVLRCLLPPEHSKNSKRTNQSEFRANKFILALFRKFKCMRTRIKRAHSLVTIQSFPADLLVLP